MRREPRFEIINAGRTRYEDAAQTQRALLESVLKDRDSGSDRAGVIMLTEHDPVVTVTRRAGASGHVLHSREALAARGVALAETDRGGDVTYHGPGQLVCYPIIDLNRVGLRIHEYMRTLEQAVIGTLGCFGVVGERDPSATGVWVPGADGRSAKVCAMGVRVRRWVSMHGLAINVDPDLDHFGLIVPCGLSGRAVTSLRRVLGAACPAMEEVAGELSGALVAAFLDAASRTRAARDQGCSDAGCSDPV